MYYSDDYLCHYGVRGMRWGVRKSRGGYSRVSTSKGRQKRGSFNSISSRVQSTTNAVKTTTSNAVNYVKANPKKVIGVGVGAVAFAAVKMSPALSAGISAYNASQLFLKNTKISDLYADDKKKTSKSSKRK